MPHNNLATSFVRIQNSVRVVNVFVLKDMRRLSIPLLILNLPHNILKRYSQKWKAGPSKHFAMEQAEMHPWFHLDHRIEVNHRVQPPPANRLATCDLQDV
jgi:hypothetical protein